MTEVFICIFANTIHRYWTDLNKNVHVDGFTDTFFF